MARACSALHELGHWTGHPSRFDRETPTKGIMEGPYSKHYAREELRAEISSMITGNRLELGHDPSRHASYVGHWIKALRDDAREVYRAARNAQAISDYILDRSRERDPSREGGRAPQPARAPSTAQGREPGSMPGAPPAGEQHRLFQRDRGREAPSR